MPTAPEYRAAALRLRRLATDLPPSARAVAFDPHALAGGPLATLLQQGLDAHRTAVDRAVAELERLAGVCTRRAEICEAYVRELRRHRDRDTWLPWSGPPEPPAWWVEV